MAAISLNTGAVSTLCKTLEMIADKLRRAETGTGGVQRYRDRPLILSSEVADLVVVLQVAIGHAEKLAKRVEGAVPHVVLASVELQRIEHALDEGGRV